jgi:hypothetical protein
MLAKQPTIIPMKRLLLCLLLAAPGAPLGAQQPGVDQNSELLIVPPDEKFLRWHGHTGRTYFLQFSTGNNPLVDWHWVPIIESGIGSEISYEVGGTEPRGFYRLQYTDEVRPSGISLEDWDVDGDNLGNLDEVGFYQTNPLAADTDGDGLTDWEEGSYYHTNPRVRDTDGDGLEDYDEAIIYVTDPWSADSDNDGVNDFEEVSVHFTDPWNVDSDGDGMRDGWEITHSLDPLDPADALGDLDSDGIPSGIEYELNLNPALLDTDGDAIADGDEDSDRDELSNFSEVAVHTSNPKRWDTDSDGTPDGWEVAFQLNPTDGVGVNGATGDPDADNLSNFEEWLNGTAPDNPDTDGDGTNDGAENTQGSNPNDNSDNGNAPPTKDLVEVPFTVSDPSGSESEKWKMTIVGKGPQDTRTTSLASVEFGEPATKTIKLRKWNRYEVTVEHLATDPDPPVNGETDYDWDATVDGLPTTQSFEKTEATVGVNNFFVIGKYWLVDNRKAVLTTEKHGDDENIVSGKKAILVPIEIGDNLTSTGVDDVSITANEDAIGYQEHFWIMAPMGGQQFSDDIYFKIPVDPPTPLDFPCANTTPDPATIDLDFTSWQTKQPVVTWRGSGVESSDNTPAFKVGEDDDVVDLPIRVKSMKKRIVNVTCYMVRTPGSANPITTCGEASLEDELNRTFGHQINAYFDVTLRQGVPEVNFDLDGDGWLHAVNQDQSITAEESAILGGVSLDPSADIHIFYPNRWLALAGYPPTPQGSEDVSNILGATPKDGNYIFISRRGQFQTETIVIKVIAHEIGHVMFGPGHPDQESGIAPLKGTDPMQRLMSSEAHSSPSSRLLVKTEWDKAEDWLRNRPNGDN